MSSATEQIKDRLPIEDVVGLYVKLERSGKNLRARCPFHNEKTPSFFVSPDRGTYYCFGCQAHGDIFTFEEFEGVDFRGALKSLAERAGVKLERVDPKKVTETEQIFEALEEATKYFENNLEKAPKIGRYLKERGLSEATIKEFRLGYAPDEWQALKDYLGGLGFREVILLKAGLLVKNEKGKIYDRFRGRIMFPLADSSGRTVAFSARVDPEREKEESVGAKYINSPETELFHKSRILYGFDKAKTHIRKYGFSIVVEGQTDLLMSHQAGYKNTVASSGTALTQEHFKILSRLSMNVVLALDADSAGIMSAKKAAMQALALDMDVKVAKLPKGKDPADVIKESPELWKEAIKQSTHIVDFTLGLVKELEVDARKRQKMITTDILPLVKAIGNKIDQAHFVKKLSEAMNVNEDAVYSELGKIDLKEYANFESEASKGRELVTKADLGRGDYIEKRILAIWLWQKEAHDPKVDPESIKERLERIRGREVILPEKKDAEDLMFEAESFFEDVEDLNVILDEMCLQLEKDILKKEMSGIIEELRIAEAERRDDDSSRLLVNYQELGKKLVELEGRSRM
jgi:DNA primase